MQRIERFRLQAELHVSLFIDPPAKIKSLPRVRRGRLLILIRQGFDG
jgi:hypothetical protein